MSDAGPEQVAVETPRRHRWLRRELWFVLAAVLVVLGVFLAVRHGPAVHTAPGEPYGTVPTPVPMVPAPRATPTTG